MAVTDLRKMPRILLMISKPTYAHMCIKVYYTRHIPPTCVGHSCGHLQGDTLQKIHGNITDVFEPMHKYFDVSILYIAISVFYICALYEESPLV